FIGGPVLARGYHGQPGLTAERFVPDPFGPPGSRLYRTGDRVRQRSDGVIDFLGRTDQQLKLRGYRIEPGEIEAALRQLPGVTEAAVVLHEAATAGPQLIGYVTGTAREPEALQADLRRRLPGYLVPSRLLLLERLPRLASGKLDRRALPAPERASTATLAPRTPTEAQLAAIWQEVLGLDRVGVSDNFFELGGHSLLALRLVSVINQRLGWTVALPQLLQFPTIQGLIDSTRAERPSPLVPLNGSDDGRPALFCLPPAGGTVFPYLPLARALMPHRRVYGLMCPGLFEPKWQPASLAEMARDYVRRMLEVQPQGPYYVLGWSLGGALAMDVAHQLEQGGQQVAFLGLVDSYAPGFEETADEGVEPDDASAFKVLRGLMREICPEFDADGQTAQLGKEPGGPGSEQARVAALTAALRSQAAVGELAALGTLDPGRAVTAMQQLSRLAPAFRPRALRVAPHCWWSQEAVGLGHHAEDVLETGWGRPAAFSAHVPADHLAIIRSPELLADLRSLLQEGAPDPRVHWKGAP
ncbi:MAG: AMP-binding protein, partial [Gammaproteobacteria bacterium]|nr:AMP-binding protein [Gammaproteobacteria bacterium]